MRNPEKNRAALPHIDLPDWIDREAWAGYLEMRLLIKKPPTARALQLSLRTLEKLRAAGHDANAVLDQSTQASWQGLFPLRAPQGQQKPADRAPTAVEDALVAWAEVRDAMRQGCMRRWTDARTERAVQTLGWAALDGMRSDQVLWYQREFVKLFNSLPAAPRASLHVLPTRKVA